MTELTYRNSLGQLVDMSTVAATKVKNEFGTILEQAMHGVAVAITRHDLPKAVLLSYDEFVSLVKDRAPQLDELTAEFDTLLAGMQHAKARRGMADAFNASPSQLGRAAVNAGRKNRRPSSKQPPRASRARRAK
ncbi:MAG: prevent-host-death family protein [Nitrospira sp.]|jgi:prevent-host-death family protein|nr:prevent-host-death family protein [Nitrospira sp.]